MLINKSIHDWQHEVIIVILKIFTKLNFYFCKKNQKTWPAKVKASHAERFRIKRIVQVSDTLSLIISSSQKMWIFFFFKLSRTEEVKGQQQPAPPQEGAAAQRNTTVCLQSQ